MTLLAYSLWIPHSIIETNCANSKLNFILMRDKICDLRGVTINDLIAELF